MKGSTRIVLQIALVLSVLATAKLTAADPDTPLFSVTDSLTMSLTPASPSDYLHADLVVFKFPLNTTPPSTFTGSDVWVGGVWSDYGDWRTKTGYTTSNGTMSCGPDVDLTAPGSGVETLSGTGGEGFWAFDFFFYYYISDGGYWYAYAPGAKLTALQAITITANGSSTALQAGGTLSPPNAPYIRIAASVPPTASSTVINSVVGVGNSVLLDGSASTVNDYGASKIVNYKWHFQNATDGTSFDASTSVPLLAQPLSDAGDYVVSLTVTDDLGLVSTNASNNNVTAVSVTFIPSTVSVAQGAKTTTSAVIVPSDAAAQVTFLTNSTTVATVSPGSVTSSPANLTISGIASGTTQLVAEVGGYTVGSLDITVLAVTHQPPTAGAKASTSVIAAGQSVLLDGSSSKANDPSATGITTWSWHFQNSTTKTGFDVSSAASQLQQTLTDAGDYVITLTVTDSLGTVSTNTSGNSVSVTAVGVTFTPQSLTLFVGQTLPVTPTIVPNDAYPYVTFGVDDTSIATLDSTTASSANSTLSVTGVAVGGTTLTAMVNGTLVGTVAVNVIQDDVSFTLDGRPLVFINSDAADANTAATSAFSIKISNPSGAQFLNPKKSDWSSDKPTVCSIGGATGSTVPVDTIAATVLAGSKGGSCTITVTTQIQLPGGKIINKAISHQWSAIRLIPNPAANPPVWLPGDPDRKFEVIREQDASSSNIGYETESWTSGGDSYAISGDSTANPVLLHAVRPSKDAINPDSIQYYLNVDVKDLNGSTDKVAGLKNVPVLVNGAELTLNSAETCVTIPTSMTGNVRAGDGKATITSPRPNTLTDAPVVNGNTLTIPTRTLNLQTPGILQIGNVGAGTITVQYASPTYPASPISKTATITVNPVDGITISGSKDIAVGDPPTVFIGTATCKGVNIAGPKITWQISDAGGTDASISEKGEFKPGKVAGNVKIKAIVAAAHNARFVYQDVSSELTVNVGDLSITIQQTGVCPPAFSAKVSSGQHDVTNQAGILWSVDGVAVAVGSALIFPNDTPDGFYKVTAHADYHGVQRDSAPLNLQVTCGNPPKPNTTIKQLFGGPPAGYTGTNWEAQVALTRINPADLLPEKTLELFKKLRITITAGTIRFRTFGAKDYTTTWFIGMDGGNFSVNDLINFSIENLEEEFPKLTPIGIYIKLYTAFYNALKDAIVFSQWNPVWAQYGVPSPGTVDAFLGTWLHGSIKLPSSLGGFDIITNGPFVIDFKGKLFPSIPGISPGTGTIIIFKPDDLLNFIIGGGK